MGERRRRGSRRAVWLTILAAAVGVPTIAIAAPAADPGGRHFEQPNPAGPTTQQFGSSNVQRFDTPNDPNYDNAEPDDPDGRTATDLYDERFDLFGFPSALTPTARYVEGPNAGKPQISGFNAAGAWKVTRGKPPGRSPVTVAILDTGIKWDRGELRDQVHLNTGELPQPNHGRTTALAPGIDCSKYASNAYDANGDGRVSVDDYACDTRVSVTWTGRHGAPGLINAEDLIHEFSNGTDGDGNHFVDDIAGWDFFDNDNDPYDASSYFAATNHGSGRADNAVEQGNDKTGSIGVCPDCQVLPIRTWDTFVSDGNTFALGILYATDNGAQVIEGANGSVYHSAFAEAASNYAYKRGVAQLFSGDDLNTANHNYPANYGHAQLVQGTVPDTVGLGSNAGQQIAKAFNLPLGTMLPVGTYFRGANTTQYGGKSSISMEGTTGSENTGKAAGAAGLVISAALTRSQPIRLLPDETREILEQTAEDVLPLNTGGTGVPDPAQPGFDTHFGYGRVDLGKAVEVAASGKIPPQAVIDSPDWYAPLTGHQVTISGLARARLATGGDFHYKLEWGVGLAPTSWQTVREGNGTGALRTLGTIDLDQVRAALAKHTVPLDTGGPTFAPDEPNPFQQQFSVRLTVTAAGVPTHGVDRRVLTTFTDPTLRPGYPKRLGTGGEAPLRYADLNGDNVPELLVPGEDGVLRALEPNGHELPGWPVRTDVQKQANGHLDAPGLRSVGPPHEPLRGVDVADLDGDGRPEVIDVAGIHVYVWEADGKLRRGFPVSENLSFCRPSLESQKPPSHPKCGFIGSPALGHLMGRKQPLDIVVAGLDGHLYAFQPNGQPVPHFPILLQDKGMPPGQRVLSESINDPAIGDLNGDGRDDVVVATNETYGAQPPNPGDLNGGIATGLADLLGGAAGGSSRVYAVNGASGAFLPGWPIKLNGAIQDTLPLIGPGQDASLVRVGGTQTVVVSTTGGALAEYSVAGKLLRAAQQSQYGAGSDATDRTGLINLFESASIGDVQGDGKPDLVKYGLSLGQLANLALSGQNVPYNHVIGAYNAGSGLPLTAFPRVTDDYQFLSSSSIAKVIPGKPVNQVLAGTGLGLLHAYDGALGHDVAGFPKQTGGWLFAPPELSPDGRLADITREGYLFEWSTRAPACQGQWPTFRHDAHSTGNYDADGTAPAAPGRLSARQVSGRRYRLTFRVPGDDRFCGRATSYVAEVNGHRTSIGLGRPTAGGSQVSRVVTLPAGARTLTLRARDEVGNTGDNATVAIRSGGGAGGGHGGRSGSGHGGSGGRRTGSQSFPHGGVEAGLGGLADR